MIIRTLISAIVVSCSAHAAVWVVPSRSAGAGASYPALAVRSDAVAVYDMQTLDGSNVANLVSGSSEYDLVGSNSSVGGTPTGPTVTSEGLAFPPIGENQNQSKAASTGTASVSALTVYLAFKRTGTTLASFNTTRLLNANLLQINTLDPTETPRFYTTGFNQYSLGRWNDSEPHFLAVTVEAGSLNAWLDGGKIIAKSGSTTFPATLSQLDLSSIAGSEGFAGTVYHMSVFNTAHNAATRANALSQVQAQLASRSVTIAKSDVYVVFEGDSITQLNYIVNQTDAYHYKSVTTIAQNPPAINFAVSGDVVANAVARAATVDALYDATRTHNVLSVFIGANDLPSGTAAQAYADVKAYCLARKAVGWKIIYCTAVVRDLIEGFEAKRLAFNTLVRDDPSFYDELVDFGADLYLGDPDEAPLTNYFADGVHPNIAGHARMAPLHKTALEAILTP